MALAKTFLHDKFIMFSDKFTMFSDNFMFSYISYFFTQYHGSVQVNYTPMFLLLIGQEKALGKSCWDASILS